MAEAAEKYVYLNNPGAYVGYYSNDQAPYMVEPMNVFVRRDKNAEIFVGPAQCGKTQSLILNTIAYTVRVSPMDMIVYCPTLSAARDFSVRRLGRMHDTSEIPGEKSEIGKLLRAEKDADNKFDKHYKTGMILSLSWPSSAELAGRPIGRVVITDRDRMDDNIDGEGEIFDLARKRTTTFGSFAMCLAESSPSRQISNPKWVRKTKHEAPPTGGILELYNRGDRRRWYWPCTDCGSYFEGTFRMLDYDMTSNVMATAETVRMICPHCNHKINPDDRYGMNLRGRWVADGQWCDDDGEVHGDMPRTDIASFWLNGVAASFISWQELVQNYLAAQQSYERTGSEEALIKFYNNDLAEPYMPKSMEMVRLPEALMARAEPLGEKVVPEGVRLLVATVDVQQNMFKVQVQGILPGSPMDMVIVDRFDIRLSAGRLDGDGQIAWVKPGTYLEDWDLITEQVLKRTYPLADDTGRHMMIKMTFCDSGGKAGVTSNAYAYYRVLRKANLHGRFHLVKGDGKVGPRWRITYPDSSNRSNTAAAQGDVPVLLLNSNLLKDELSTKLDGMIPGKGMVRFPDWLPDWFYGELCAEQRTDKGWENPAHQRNEAWDLMYYCIGGCISSLIGIEHIDWNKPLQWADTWDNNSLVVHGSRKDRFVEQTASQYDFAALARSLA